MSHNIKNGLFKHRESECLLTTLKPINNFVHQSVKPYNPSMLHPGLNKGYMSDKLQTDELNFELSTPYPSYATGLDELDPSYRTKSKLSLYTTQYPKLSKTDVRAISLEDALLTPETNLNKLNKSSYSLSELDNIKKETINNLKNYKTKFSTLNTKFRTKIAKTLHEFNGHNKLPYLERLIRKSGEANIERVNIESQHLKYISDLFNTMVDMKWRFILFLFGMCFLVSWILFAILWFLLPSHCVGNMHDQSFIDALLFSIETQQTIGYGVRHITKECNTGVLILMVQCGFSVVLESLIGGVVFAKLSRPKKRTETLIFSKRAVIAPRDGKLCLMCRVGDMRKSHIIQAYARMFLIQTRVTREGEIIPWNAQELDLTNNLKSSDRLLFMPIIVEHVIDESSPLFKLISFPKSRNFNNTKNTRRFKCNDFEIVVILEGTVESTGQTTQARTSFLPSEILWNHVFEPLLDSSMQSSKATIDFSKFNFTKKLDFFIKKERKKNLLNYLGVNQSMSNRIKFKNNLSDLSESVSVSPSTSSTGSNSNDRRSGSFKRMSNKSGRNFGSSIRQLVTSVEKINETIRSGRRSVNLARSMRSNKSSCNLIAASNHLV